MLEQAAKSLENFLKTNIDKIKESSTNTNILREAWLKMYPQYRQYDLQLDVEWQDCTDEVKGCLNGCCPWVFPTAKGLKVFTRDWDDERYINNKVGELGRARSQLAAVREDLDFYARLEAGNFLV